MNSYDEQTMIDAGVDKGAEVAFKLMNSEEYDEDAAMLSCITTCYAQLILRGWSKEDIQENIDFSYEKGMELKRMGYN